MTKRKGGRKASTVGRGIGIGGGRMESIPLWMQGIAAIAGVMLTGLAVFGLVRAPDDTGNADPTAPGPAAAASVSLTAVTTDEGEIVGSGTFAGLDVGRESVLFIGQPTEGDVEWLPVVAQTTSTRIGADGRQDGDWRATRPMVEGPYTWFAIIGPKVVGAQDQYADIRRNGPASDLVIAASEPLATGD